MIVIENSIVSVEYFFDKMQMYEVNTILKQLQYRNKTSWEQTRFNSYINAQINNSKKIKLTDILTFSWDEMKDKPQEEINDSEIKRLKDKAEAYKQILK